VAEPQPAAGSSLQSAPPHRDYVLQASLLKAEDRFTMMVNFGHVKAYNAELAQTIKTFYFR
jgi:hypothetical protein